MTDTNSINRIVWALGAFAALLGIIALASAPWTLPKLFPAIGGTVFAFDPAFLPVGCLLVGGLWVLNAMLFAIIFADGQWRSLTRGLDIALNATWAAALLWLVIGPQIYLSPATDSAAKGWIAVVLTMVVVSMIPKLFRAVRG